MKKETAFTESLFQEIYPEGVNNFYWNDARNNIILNTINNLQLQAPIVEIGCGKGGVVEFIHQNNLEIKGYEIAKIQPYESVKDLIYTNTNAIGLAPCEANGYKTMMLLDVIEHIEQPVSFVNGLLSTFKDVRHLLITVPARNEVFSNYDTHYGHFLRYDFESATQLAKELNLNIVHLSYFFKGLYPPSRLMKILNKDRKTAIIPPKGNMQKKLHRIISRYFQTEHSTLPKSWKGTSLLLVLSK